MLWQQSKTTRYYDTGRKHQLNNMALTTGFSVSKEDMLRGKAVKPGVYLLLIKDFDQKPSKRNPDSITTYVYFVIESNDEYNGIPITYYLSDAAPGMAVDFLQAVMNKKLPEDGLSVTKEQLYALKGRKVKAAIKMEKTESYGEQKRIEGFMPV